MAVDRQHHDADAVGGQRLALAQHGGPDVTDAQAVHVNPAGLEALPARDLAIAELEHVPVLADEDVVVFEPGVPRDLAVGDHVAVLTVDGHEVLRPHDVVVEAQLVGGGVAGHVDLGDALVDDVGALAEQTVDRAEDGVLVARDDRRGHDHGVADLE